jgi:hypothetical protein
MVIAFLLPLAWTVNGLDIRTTPMYSSRLELLGAAADQASDTGLWLEFGVYRGETLNFLALRAPGSIFGFDSFLGLPAGWARGYPKGSFSLEGRVPEVASNVQLVKGKFSETLPAFVRVHAPLRVSFVHVDCDLYSSARDVLIGLSPGIVDGTIVVFDEFVTLYPDDEARAFRELVRNYSFQSSFIGCSPSGSVAVRFGSKTIGPRHREGLHPAQPG